MAARASKANGSTRFLSSKFGTYTLVCQIQYLGYPGAW
jgi:hypothetical protein